ncbi:MAG: NADP-dependent oxidoreductase [Actinomycetota bacterium]|nr:NADP-dependent oxidoreductase [Actinomycetota bacterium]
MSFAVQFARYGTADVLELIEIALPDPGPGQVRLSVRAAGVNPLDWKQRSGAVREVMPLELPARLCVDVAGVVDAVGTEVSRVKVGDHVLGRAVNGTYASDAIAHETELARKPDTMAWEVAALLPVVATTAAHALATLGLRSGDIFVIDGASGAVGTFAVQLAAQRGVRVLGTGSPGSHARLRCLGAMPIAHGPRLAERILEATHGAAPTAGLDAAGVGGLADLVSVVGVAERVVTLADPHAFALGAVFLGAGSTLTEEPVSLQALADHVAAGVLAHPAGTTYPLAAATDAHHDGEVGRLKGKAVLIPSTAHDGDHGNATAILTAPSTVINSIPGC